MLTGQIKRDYQNKWLQDRRSTWIESQGGVCVKCGSTNDLEVDHIDPSLKTMNPRSIWSRTSDIRTKELNNCQVLCSLCHKDKTKVEQSTPIIHGSYNRGYKKGCNCTDCRNSIAPYWREYRKQRALAQRIELQATNL